MTDEVTEEPIGFYIEFDKRGVVYFDKFTTADYVDLLNKTVIRLKETQEQLRQVEVRLNCLRNEIENISPKID